MCVCVRMCVRVRVCVSRNFLTNCFINALSQGGSEVQGFKCDTPVNTVLSFLRSRDCESMLQDAELLERAAEVGDLRVMSSEGLYERVSA